MKLKLYDAFPTKAGAKHAAKRYRELGVQYVQVRKVNQGRLKWGVYLGGRNSRSY